MVPVEDTPALVLVSAHSVHFNKICYRALMSNVESKLGSLKTGRDFEGSKVRLGLGLGRTEVLGNVLRNSIIGMCNI